jgi:hypothetical protein
MDHSTKKCPNCRILLETAKLVEYNRCLEETSKLSQEREGLNIKENPTIRFRKNHPEVEDSSGGLNTERNQINIPGNVFLRIDTQPADGNDGDKGPGEFMFTDVNNPDGGVIGNWMNLQR